MVGFTAHDRAQGNQRIELFGTCHLLERIGNFQRPRHGTKEDIVFVHAKPFQFGQTGVAQGHNDGLVETRLNNADPDALSIEVCCKNFN